MAGGVAGATGTILTCPLEIVKTRLQSSTSSYKRMISTAEATLKSPNVTSNSSAPSNSTTSSNLNNLNNRIKFSSAHSGSLNSTILFRNNHLSQPVVSHGINFTNSINTSSKSLQPKAGLGIILHLRFILENEGYRALFKGLGPTLVGVAPYRAIYFYSYANSKKNFSKYVKADSPILHVMSAFVAGFSAVSVTNPVWFIKTRMQLDESRAGITIRQVISKVYQKNGITGFYKGISASYFGIIETALYFSIYEKLKSLTNKELNDSQTFAKFLSYFGSAGFSKSLASIVCYPHEVARTRLREEGSKYNSFFQTLRLVAHEEGAKGLYKGMGTHLIRQIPNSMIVMITYELIINHFTVSDNKKENSE